MADEVFTHDVWADLKVHYEQINQGDAVLRASVSILNSILTQERIYFAMSRRGIEHLIQNDKNLSNNKAFKASVYPTILAFLMEQGYIEKIVEGNTLTANGYKVVHPMYLDFLSRSIDKEAQLNEIKAFCKSGTNLGTSLGTKEPKDIRTKELKSRRTEETETALHSPIAVASASKTEQTAPSVIKVTSGSNNPKEMETTPQSPRCAAPLNQSDVESLESAAASMQTEWERTFVADCRAALERFGSLTEGKRKKLKEIASKPAPDTRPVIQKNQLIGILQIPKLSADKQLKVIKDYRLPADSIHLQQLTEIIALHSPDTAETLANGLGLTLSDTQLGALRAREKRNSDRLKLETELSTVTSKEQLEAMGAVQRSTGLFVLKGHHVEFNEQKARLV